ncbi:MAG TPA: hypothetical protein VN734_12790 [Acidobacteriaceae bacterium]|nr:hypothetical protein [Acidobacteriaceae bacterium]
MAISLTEAVLAVGALGTAATGLVDSTKAFSGGISRAGFGYIKQLIARTIPSGPNAQAGSGLGADDILNTLLANWMNGMDPGGQKAIAKSFIKLHLNSATAAALAAQTNVDPAALANVAAKLAAMQSLTNPEADAFGRFDLALSALIDRAYGRADQFYRNWCKVLACIFAIVLAWLGNRALGTTLPRWEIIIIGLIATPLAPMAKDIANAIQTASDTIGKLKG